MEFDTEADPEFMHELFGIDVESLAECVSTFTFNPALIFDIGAEDPCGCTFWNAVELLKFGTLSWATQIQRSRAPPLQTVYARSTAFRKCKTP